MKPQTYTVNGSDLRKGDSIEVGSGRRATIVNLVPYNGPLTCLDGARLAYFAAGGGMTIEASAIFTVVHA
jgi:hypothetical protein